MAVDTVRGAYSGLGLGLEPAGPADKCMWLRVKGRSGADARALAGAAKRLAEAHCGLDSPFIFWCCKPGSPSAEAARRLFIHGFRQEIFPEIQPGSFQPAGLPYLVPAVSDSRVNALPAQPGRQGFICCLSETWGS